MYSLRSIDVSKPGISSVRELFRTVWPNARHLTTDYLSWLYSKNPMGDVLGFNAFEEATGKLAAHYATVPIEASVEGRRVKGLLSLNTATHPKHQGNKLFTRLAEKTYDLASDGAFEFVVGVANANSTPGFTKRLGFKTICSLQARVGIGSCGQRSKGDAKQPAGFEVSWNAESIKWRLAAPGRKYTVQSSKRFSVKTYILGKSSVPFLPVVMKSHLQGIEDGLPTQKPAAIARPWLYVGHDSRIQWDSSKSLSILHRWRPSPLNLIFKSLAAKPLSVVAADLTFCALDFDAY